MGRLLAFLCVVIGIGSVLVMGAGSVGATQSDAVKTEGVPQFGNVFVIIGENTEITQLTKKNAPYLLGMVKPESAWLTNYWATTHYSEANYVAMTSGQFTACEQKDGSIASCHQDVPNLFNQLDQIRGPDAWQSWMESMPTACDISSAGGDQTQNHYAPKHNPALNFNDVAGTWNGSSLTPSAECTNQDIPAGTTGPNNMDDFNAALATNNVSGFNFVVPNECEDGHSSCPPAGHPVLQFDNFLQREVPLILNSPAFGSNGVLIVTFDEGTINSPNHANKFEQGGNVAFAVVSPLAYTGSYGNEWNHYSFLRTLEDGLGVSSLGYVGNAASATPINTIWK